MSTLEAETAAVDFVTNCVVICWCNITNRNWHEKHDKAALQMLGFETFNKTLSCVSSFFNNVNLEFPIIKVVDKNVQIKPDNFTAIEQMLIVKMFMH